jgi:hypothetical protein
MLAAILVAAPAAAAVRDPLDAARQLYNEGSYDRAIEAADAIAVPALVHAARLVSGRARLERYRRQNEQSDLADARTAFLSIDSAALTARERLELVIGFAEALFLEGSYGASAELFASVVDQPAAWQAAGPNGRERLLEWWAGAIDREAQQTRGLARDDLFGRLRQWQATGWPPPRAARAISIAPGTPRWPAGSARGSWARARGNCPTTSIASSANRSSRPAHGATPTT